MVNRYGSVKGGAESYLRALTGALAERGHDVAMASHLENDETWPAVRRGYSFAAATSKSADPAASERNEVQRILDAFRPDVVHIHNIEATWLPAFLSQRVPTIFAVHDHRISCPTGTRYWAAWKRECGIEPGAVCLGYNAVAHCGSYRANATLKPYRAWRAWRAAATKVPRLQVFSNYMASTLRLAGLPESRVAVTPYPVPPLAAPATLHDRTDPRPVVFATGRLVKEKGFDLLLEALDHLRAPVVCAIAGTGHHADALVARGASGSHEVLWLGWLTPDELSAWYRRAALVVVPSAWPEPFGIVGLEAMASERAVVATDVGGIREWLVDGETGIAVTPGDARALATAIDRLLGDDELRASMGRSGMERATSTFSLSRHAQQIEALYETTRSGTVSAA